MFIPVCGKEAGYGFTFQVNFAPEARADHPAYGALGRLKRIEKRGEGTWGAGLGNEKAFPVGKRGRTVIWDAINSPEIFPEFPELGGGSAAIAALKNGEIPYNIHSV
jgi:hypothetical protein